MDKEQLKKVKIINNSGVELIGRIYESEKKDDVLFLCPGFGGSYGALGRNFSEYAKENNMSFFWGQFRDTYSQKVVNKFDENGNKEKIQVGATNSCLNYSEEDFEAFFRYLDEQGYKKIQMVATCVSCSKLIKYLLENNKYSDKVESVCLMALQDLAEIKQKPKLAGFEEEAYFNCQNGEPFKILSRDFLGYLPISSYTYLDLCNNQEYNTIPYISNQEKLARLKSLNIPILFVLAQYDGSVRRFGEDAAEKFLKVCAENCQHGEYKVIENATHLFEGKEELVVKAYKEFINKKIKFNEEGVEYVQ